MKQKFLTIGILLVTSVLSMSSFSIREKPQDPPHGKKAQKHIVVEKTDEKGNKITLDTIVSNDKIFVWNGDTIGGKSAFNWFENDEFDADSLLKNMTFNFEYEIDDDGENKVFVLKSGKGGKHSIHEFVTNGDSNKVIEIRVDSDDFMKDHNFMVWNDDEGNNTFFAPYISNLPQLPGVPKMIFSEKINRDNVIDLSDPGIISYKKKKNKDGTEKITIVRKQGNKDEMGKTEEIILAPEHGNSDAFFRGSPMVKKIKVTKEDGKETKVEVEEKEIENN